MHSQSFWEQATLEAMQDELAKANSLRDEAYARLRASEEEAKKAHDFARLTEQRLNYWKDRRNLAAKESRNA